MKNKFIREVLWDINVRFRAIASLNRIIVRVYSGSPAPSVREFLQELDWVVLVGGAQVCWNGFRILVIYIQWLGSYDDTMNKRWRDNFERKYILYLVFMQKSNMPPSLEYS